MESARFFCGSLILYLLYLLYLSHVASQRAPTPPTPSSINQRLGAIFASYFLLFSDILFVHLFYVHTYLLTRANCQLFIVKGDGTDESRLRFPIERSLDKLEVDNAVLRILSPAVSEESPIKTKTTSPILAVRVQVFQLMDADDIHSFQHLFDRLRRKNRRRLVIERYVYLSTLNLTKWCEFDVTDLVQGWFDGESNVGIELSYTYTTTDSNGDYRGQLIPLEAAISALVYTNSNRNSNSNHRGSNRDRRSIPNVSESRRSDCPRRGKRKCCRHRLNVKFAELEFPEMNLILQPKSYEAGYCQGQCPPNYIYATNHSRIQALVHQLDRNRKNGAPNRANNRRPVPKVCCTPSKLKSLDIVRVDPNNASKLMVEVWDNMEVEECACS